MKISHIPLILVLATLAYASLATATVPNATLENCTCDDCADTVVATGSCIDDTTAGQSRTLSCFAQDAVCAQLLVLSGEGCATFLAGAGLMCNKCTRVHGMHSYAVCDTVSENVTFYDDCGETCATCNTPSVYHYDCRVCSAHTARTGMYNQGLFACDGVSVDVYGSSDCSGSIIEKYSEAFGSCDSDGEAMYCTPALSPVVPPRRNGDTVSFSKCNLGSECNSDCTTTEFTSGACVANPGQGTGAYVEIGCGAASASCADFAVSVGGNCSNVAGFEQHTCGSCSPWFTGDEYARMDCNDTSGDVTVTFGCDSTCGSCNGAPTTLSQLSCAASDSALSYSVNYRGMTSCAIMNVKEFSDSSCTTQTAAYPMSVSGCQLSRSAVCWNAPSRSKSSSSLSGGAIAGIVIGCVVFVGLIAGLIAYFVVSAQSKPEPEVKLDEMMETLSSSSRGLLNG